MKVIALTLLDGKVIAIKASKIQGISDLETKTLVRISSGEILSVKESKKEILKKICSIDIEHKEDYIKS